MVPLELSDRVAVELDVSVAVSLVVDVVICEDVEVEETNGGAFSA